MIGVPRVALSPSDDITDLSTAVSNLILVSPSSLSAPEIERVNIDSGNETITVDPAMRPPSRDSLRSLTRVDTPLPIPEGERRRSSLGVLAEQKEYTREWEGSSTVHLYPKLSTSHEPWVMAPYGKHPELQNRRPSV
jgi:hypothetical protein